MRYTLPTTMGTSVRTFSFVPPVLASAEAGLYDIRRLLSLGVGWGLLTFAMGALSPWERSRGEGKARSETNPKERRSEGLN